MVVQVNTEETLASGHGGDDDLEESRVVYRGSPTQREQSVGPSQLEPTASAKHPRPDLDMIRQRLISAVRKPSGAAMSALGVIATNTPGRSDNFTAEAFPKKCC